MKNTYTFKSVLVASILTLSASAFADIAKEAYYTPDEKQANCAMNPSQIAGIPDLVDGISAFGGTLDYVVGTWKLVGIPFVNQKISFKYDNTQFLVQTNMEPSQKAALCSFTNEKGEKMIRVSIVTPGCPENKNIYLRGGGHGVMFLSAYATRKIGSARFELKSATPLPEGQPVPPVACAADQKDDSADDITQQNSSSATGDQGDSAATTPAAPAAPADPAAPVTSNN